MLDKDSTATAPKKIMLLNNLNLSTSYDVSADSLRWSPMRVSGGTLFFKQVEMLLNGVNFFV